MRSSSLLLALAALVVEHVAAHGFVAGVEVNGVWTAGADPVWYYYPEGEEPVTAGWMALNQDNGFVAPDAYTTTDIACHKSATAGQSYVNVAAGDDITFYWSGWADSHKGPIMNYIAPCTGECTSETAGDLKFSKITEDSIVDASAEEWITDDLIANNFSVTSTLPSSLKAGNYVLRHEIIALHSAGQENGAQNYPKCINLKVTGSGTATPAGTPANKLYTATDPGIKVNVYGGDMSSYEMPGPALFDGASSGSGNASAPAAKPSATTPAASSAPAATSAAPAKVVATPAASSAAAPASTGSASIADKEFTLDTFIAWLEEKAGSSSSQKVRRHPRAFRV